MKIYKKRTDLALESAQTVRKNEALPEGIELKERSLSCFGVTDVDVRTSAAADLIGKPVGRYVTLKSRLRLDMRPGDFDGYINDLAAEISALKGDAGRVLVVGLGNVSITPDSLGPKVCEGIFATLHLRENAPQLLSDGLGEVCAIAPGVMGKTGIEASEVVKAVCRSVEPDLVIAIDALACSETGNIGKTVQLTDTGISPGSGVMNSRKELSKGTLGVPCLAIGVPTVSDSGGEGEPLMVTPRSVDSLISCTAKMISMAVNRSLHPGLTMEEIEGLVG